MILSLSRLVFAACFLLISPVIASPARAQTPQEKNAQPKVLDPVDRAVATVTGNPAAKMDTDMKHVIDAFEGMHPKAIENLTASEARKQPSVQDAALQVQREAGRPTLPDPNFKTRNIVVDGAAGTIPATIYTPEEANGPLPVIVYFHGGGFVIANNNTYDATARLLAGGVNAIVVSVDYRKAPEHKFPAAHDDAIAAYKWVLKNAKSIGGDPRRIAVAGESAGGNLAINTAIAARDQKLRMPLYQLLVYPVAGTRTDTPSYKDSADAKPLGKPAMQWFFRNLVHGPQELQDRRLDVINKAELKGLPPAMVITAQIDPLRSDGLTLVERLKAAGVTVDAENYQGVTHEFFGMGLVVGKAKQAEDKAVAGLKAAFAEPLPK